MTAALATILAAALFACGGAEATGEDFHDTLGQDTAEITNHFWSFAGYNNYQQVDTPQSAAATVCELWPAGCSCVLVARNVVLTAAHCTEGIDFREFKIGFPRRATDPWPGIATVGHHWVDVDGDGQPETQFKYVGDASEDWFKASAKYERPAYAGDKAPGADIAMIVLTDNVPPEVVEAIAPVNWGNVGKAIKNRGTSDPARLPAAIAVGRGGGNPMRIGPMGRIWAKWDTCGWFESPNFCVNTCQYLPEIRAEKNSRRQDLPLLQPGDSGGPLFVYNQEARRYEVIGVNHGGRTCPDPDVQVWAHTGTLLEDGDGGIGTRVKAALEDDPDGDGWPSSVDNCPDVFNPDQKDLDGDGVGDLCDNCPGDWCRRSGDFSSCYNPSQNDFDNDKIGDKCDLCPETSSGNWYTGAQRDSDDDGVGNECDGAPGVQIPYLECEDDAFCAASFAGFCVKEPTETKGHCSRQIDSDNDGIEDSVDLCVGWDDPTNSNSNAIAEELRGVEPKGDVCDEVPLFRLLEQPNPSADGDSEDHDYWRKRAPLRGQTIYGDNPRGSLDAEIAFRHCSCFKQAGSTDEWEDDLECAQNVCDTDDAETSHQRWMKISLEDSVTKRTLSPPDRLAASRFTPGTEGPLRDLAWNWSDDPIDTRTVHRIEQLDTVQMSNGLVASVVADRLKNWKTDRDFNSQLRVSTRRYITMPPGRPQVEFKFGQSEWFRCVTNPGCNLWIWDAWMAVVNPADQRKGHPMSLVLDSLASTLVYIDDRGGLTPVSTAPDLVAVASVGDVAWIPASEPPAVLSRYGIATQAIGLSLQTEATPLAVVVDAGQIQLQSRMAMAIAGPTGSVGLRLPPGAIGLFSALENRVLLVGADDEFHDFLQVYDLGEEDWHNPDWALDHTPQVALLAAGYDALGQVLYVLQVDNGAAGPLLRMVAHRLGRQESEVVWEAAATDWSGRYALATLPDRVPVLIESAGGQHKVCRFEGGQFVGMSSGPGESIGLPAATGDGVGFLVSDQGEWTQRVSIPLGARDPKVSCL